MAPRPWLWRSSLLCSKSEIGNRGGEDGLIALLDAHELRKIAGTTNAGISDAKAQGAWVLAAADKVRAASRRATHSTYTTALKSIAALAVGRKSVEQAESSRIKTKRHEAAAAATPLEVLDAESC